jgi:hypothetical protein
MSFKFPMDSGLYKVIEQFTSFQKDYQKLHNNLNPYLDSINELRKIVDPMISIMRPFIQMKDAIMNDPEINYLVIDTLDELDITEIDSIESRINDNLTPLLTKYNLLNLWIGADFAMTTSIEVNPDKLRHFLISLRTIFEQSIDKLAPEKSVRCHKIWTDYVEELNEKGRNTPVKVPRELQIKYFCEKFQFRFFEDFAKEETTFINGLYSKLCKVHSPNIKFQDKDLRFIRLNAGLTIWLFLYINEFLRNNEGCI